MNRRTFLGYSPAASSLCAMPALVPGLLHGSITPKRILVIGGTVFLGPAIVQAALNAGHTVTLFNRGVTSPELFPHVEKLRGFRSSDASDQDLSALPHRHWDAVIDVWPHDPFMAASAAELLKDRTSLPLRVFHRRLRFEGF